MHRNDACLIYRLLGTHIICRGEYDSKNGRNIFVIRRFSVERFDAAANRFCLCGGCFAQALFMTMVQMEFEPVGHPFYAKRGAGFSNY